MKKNIGYLITYILIVGVILGSVMAAVIYVDPFFHYHNPKTEEFYYPLDNERSMNDGIVKFADFDAMIIGTSMTENFRKTEADYFFNINSIKTPFSGGTYKEMNDLVVKALKYQPKLKTVIRGLDMSLLEYDKNARRTDLGDFPDYLYNKNPLDDVQYIYNRNVIFDRVLPMLYDSNDADYKPGIDNFNLYATWGWDYTYGIDTLINRTDLTNPKTPERDELRGSRKRTVRENVKKNVVQVALDNPDVTFYYFITPYSCLWWRDKINDGTIGSYLDAERILIEECLQCPNIKLYSFNNYSDITMDLNNYKDDGHYGPWINSLILRYMRDGEGLLTIDNYEEYLEATDKLYSTFNYYNLSTQEDYADDTYAETLLHEKIYGGTDLD